METSVNNKCKAFTSLEQSKKLAEFLPLESADACWTNHLFDRFLSSWRVESTPPQKYKCLLDRFVVSGYLIEPAWSLAALLGVLPNKIVSHETAFDDVEDISDTYYKHIELTEVGHYICCYVGNGYKYKCVADKPVDACYEMILKLHELNLL